MKRLSVPLRMSLGGAVCGGYLGILGGAVVGAVYGFCVHNVSLGLDGAMLGGAAAASVGAMFGMVSGLLEGTKKETGEALAPQADPEI
jgi:hypothetical protein